MGSVRRTTAYGQVLLCAALLLGIFTMHTVGHPADRPPAMAFPSNASASTASASMDSAAMASAPMDSHPMVSPALPPTASLPMTVMEHSAVAGGTPHAAHGERPAAATPHPRHHLPGMDPGSVCLAVLGVWGLALLAARLVSARGRTTGAAVARGRIPRPLWPNPPPPYGSYVAALSVLRQ
ncbi:MULTISPECIES: hypothetical protein [unclassified Streptomyces]|uniref:hypothetical protein n=1 Tax=unclassified Streptomyces TaxID=2593676 RepID=UPI00340392EA